MFHPMKPETIARKQREAVEERRAIRTDLYKRLVMAAWNNRHNPTGRDYLESAKKYRPTK